MGFNQADFAAFAGVAKTSQFNYEKGDRSPDAAYLAAVAEKGVDVLYVVTGERKPLPSTSLSREVSEFFEVYQLVSETDRDVLYRTACAFARAADPSWKKGSA